MTIALWIGGVLLAIAAVLTVWRIAVGPSAVDRVVATDVLLTILVMTVAIESAIHRHSFGIPLMIAASALAFAGTVAMARFVAARRDLLSRGEAAKRQGARTTTRQGAQPADSDAAKNPRQDVPAEDHEASQ